MDSNVPAPPDKSSTAAQVNAQHAQKQDSKLRTIPVYVPILIVSLSKAAFLAQITVNMIRLKMNVFVTQVSSPLSQLV